ncbi:MAG: OmpA family protein [Nitrospinae bacterium]|nr:OmpA family protein [Nitrospinota bacterium]
MCVEGHADATGSAYENQLLSEERAKRVAEVLGTSGVSREQLTVKGYGACRPIASNDTAEGRQRNRRMEIIIEH